MAVPQELKLQQAVAITGLYSASMHVTIAVTLQLARNLNLARDGGPATQSNKH